MKTYDELDAWGVLGLARGANAEQIRDAYEHLSARLAPGSLALYSIADREEQQALQRRLRAAYLELLDEVGAVQHPPRADAEAAAASDADLASAPGPGPAEPFDDDFLRRAREAVGLSLDALSHRTRIRRHLLEAVETERFAELPQRVFVRGFVVTIARELGLDPERAWAAYGARLEAWAAGSR